MKRELLLVGLSMFAWGLGESMFLYFQPLYMEQLGADPLLIGGILGAFGLAMTVSHIPAGYLADRIGRKPLLVAAWVLGTLATWTMALAEGLPIFVAGLLLYGITIFVMSPLESYVAEARGGLSVGRAITLISACFNLGAVFGPWFGGQVGDQLGLRQTYFIAGGVFIASSLVILFIRPQPIEHTEIREKASGWIFSPRYLIYMGVIFLAMFATYLPQPLTPNYLASQGGLDLSRIGTLYSIASVGVVVLNLTVGTLPARFGFLLGQLAVGSFALLLWRGTGSRWLTPAFFLLGGFKTARSLGMAQVRELAPASSMGLAFGLSETVAAMAVILAPLTAGYLYTVDPAWMYLMGAGLILVSLAVSARFSPRPTAGSPGVQVPAHLDLDVDRPP
jgi:MFS family permease